MLKSGLCMKRQALTLVIGILIGALLFGGTLAVAATVQANTAAFDVSVDGTKIDATAYSIEGRTYLQLRDIAKALDIGLWWDEANRIARIETDKKYDPDYAGPFASGRLSVIGDSITGLYPQHADKNWPMWVQELLQMATLDNKGLTSTTIAKQVGRTDSMLERYTLMDANADLVCVMGGSNDCHRGVPIGTLGNGDEYTFYGAVESLVKGLINRYPTKTIVFIAPIQRGNIPDGQRPMTDYNAVIMEICAIYSIPVYDAYNNVGISVNIPAQVSAFFNPAELAAPVHPNNAGHERIGRAVAAFVNSSVAGVK